MVPTAEAVAHWVKVNGCEPKGLTAMLPDLDPFDGTRIEQTVYPNGRNKTEVQLLRVEGGGHTWPGGKQYLPSRRVGKVSQDLNASRAILDFFDRHAKP